VAVLRKTAVVAGGVAAALAVGQAPEFAQQYRQRLGGAIEEMQAVVTRFDEDAARSGLSRDEALALYGASAEAFFRDRGTSMREAIARYESLVAQVQRMGAMEPIVRPLALMRGYDDRLMRGAWRDFEPALPITPHGLAWAASGFGIGALMTMALARLLGFGRRRRRATRQYR
jgi:hypothetical protein